MDTTQSPDSSVTSGEYVPIGASGPPYTRVLLPLDGTPEAARAIGPAAMLAKESGARLETVSATRSAVASEFSHRLDAQLEAAGVEPAERTFNFDLVPNSRVIADMLRAEADKPEHSLVVVADRGASRVGELRGSFAESLLAETGGPVLVIGPSCSRGLHLGAGKRLVVAVDQPELDRRLVPLVAAWARAWNLDVELVHVREHPRAGGAAEAARWQHAEAAIRDEQKMAGELSGAVEEQVSFRLIDARKASAGIVDHAADPDVAAVVIASHRRTTAARLLLGSVAMGVVHDAPCPVLIVKPEAS